jgi:hypothetical protein
MIVTKQARESRDEQNPAYRLIRQIFFCYQWFENYSNSIVTPV